MKTPAEKKKTTETAEVLAASGLKTYLRSTDGAVMAEIEARLLLERRASRACVWTRSDDVSPPLLPQRPAHPRIAAQSNPKPPRPEAIRRLLEKALGK